MDKEFILTQIEILTREANSDRYTSDQIVEHMLARFERIKQALSDSE